MTRQNAIPVEVTDAINNESQDVSATSTQTYPALIPLWDFANHTDGFVSTTYNVKDSQIEGATLKALKKGEQIFIHYGNRNNVTLLVHNG